MLTVDRLIEPSGLPLVHGLWLPRRPRLLGFRFRRRPQLRLQNLVRLVQLYIKEKRYPFWGEVADLRMNRRGGPFAQKRRKV